MTYTGYDFSHTAHQIHLKLLRIEWLRRLCRCRCRNGFRLIRLLSLLRLCRHFLCDFFFRLSDDLLRHHFPVGTSEIDHRLRRRLCRRCRLIRLFVLFVLFLLLQTALCCLLHAFLINLLLLRRERCVFPFQLQRLLYIFSAVEPEHQIIAGCQTLLHLSGLSVQLCKLICPALRILLSKIFLQNRNQLLNRTASATIQLIF